MSSPNDLSDPLLNACDAMLREILGFPLTPERLEDAAPVIRDIVRAIRTLDEVDVREIEPATIFRVRA